MLHNDQQIIEETERKIMEFLVTNVSKNTMYQNLWDGGQGR
jgi:hypothetical protein